VKKVTIIVVIVAGLSLVSGVLCAQEGTGGTRSVFSVGAGSRAIAMGGAFSAIGDDPSAIYYNPAALRLNRYAGVLLNHTPLFSNFSDASYEFAGLAYPTLSAGSIGIGIMTVGTGGIRGFDQFSRETDEISYRESQFLLGYAFNLPWHYVGDLTAGSSVKLLTQRVGDYSDTGAGLDLGFLYRPPRLRGVLIGCNLQDIIGAETKLVSVSEKVDRTVMVGAGYTYAFSNGSAISLAVQMDAPRRDDTKMRFGAECVLKRLLSVRVGYDSEKITAGIGIGWHGVGIDYGYFSRDEAGSSHPLSLSAHFGPALEDRIRVREERRLREQERRIQQIFLNRIAGHVSAAEKFRAEGALPQALDELKAALEYDPTNTAVAETLAVVGREILRQEETRTQTAEKAALINQHFRLGLGYYSKDDYVLARAEWRNVLDLDPENAQAREYLQKTEAKLKAQADGHRARAMELERTGQLAAALGEWNLVRTLDPSSTEALQAAERINQRLDELSRDYSETSKRLKVMQLFDEAMKAFQNGAYPEAAKSLRELLAIQSDHAEARALLRRAERRMTPLTEAEKEQVRALYIEGMKSFTQNDYAQAIAQWKKILDIDPDNESVMKNIEEARKRLENAGSSEGR
jgi:tetratricopeptide (TPR) repeat protein